MTFLIAPNPFKGTLSARQVADAMARGLIRGLPNSKIIKMPLSDGGPGLIDALESIRGARGQVLKVQGPMKGQVSARWLMLPRRRAVIESAQACGMDRLRQVNAKTAWQASTYGVGQLMLAAKKAGAREILIGIGGTASTDGGEGMLRCLSGHSTKSTKLQGRGSMLPGVHVVGLCDVDNPLIGVKGSARVYAPQKGATVVLVKKLENRLLRQAQAQGYIYRNLPYTGAGGGLAFGLKTGCRARLVSGADEVLKLLNIDQSLAASDWVLTGEGRLDSQSLSGKLPVRLARRAAQVGTKCMLICGKVKLSRAQFRRSASISMVNLETDSSLVGRKTGRIIEKKVEVWARTGLK